MSNTNPTRLPEPSEQPTVRPEGSSDEDQNTARPSDLGDQPTIRPRRGEEVQPQLPTTHRGDGPASGSRPVPLQSPSSPELPDSFGDFELLEEIARGGMGVIFRACQLSVNRIVALKMISSGKLADRDDIERFYLEAEAAGNLDHPGIVPIYEAGCHEGQHYIAMAFVDGGSLAHYLHDRGSLPEQEAAELTWKIADAMTVAHEQGIIHRDLKPANVLLTKDHQPKVADFGLARRYQEDSDRTLPGIALGTPSFMPPEQAKGRLDEIGPASDVYSIGAILYVLLTGRPPFQAPTVIEIQRQVVDAEAISPRRMNRSISRDLETICLKCLEKDRHRRYPNAKELADDLRRYLDHQPILARPIGTIGRLSRFVRRNPIVSTLVLLFLLTLIVGTGVSLAYAISANAQRDEADTQRRRAEENAEKERQHRTRLLVTMGDRHRAAGDFQKSLLWYVRAWEQEKNDKSVERSHRIRVASVLQQMPFMIGFCPHKEAVLEARFFHDKDLLFARTENNVIIWDYRKGVKVRTLAHPKRVNHAELNARDTQIVTACDDGWARVWNVKTGEIENEFPHELPAKWATFDPQEPRLIIASGKGIAGWSLSNGQQTGPEMKFDAGVSHVRFNRQGDCLVAATEDHQAHVLDARSGKILASVSHRSITDQERYQFAVHPWPRFSPEGDLLVTQKISGNRLSILGWDLSTNTERWEVDNPESGRQDVIREINFSPDGRLVLINGAWNQVLCLNSVDGNEQFRLTHQRNCQYGTLSPDGIHVLTASTGGEVHLWNLSDQKEIWQPPKFATFPSSVRFNSDGAQCLASSQDGTVRVWSVAPRKQQRTDYSFEDGKADYVHWARNPYKPDYSFSPDGKQEVFITHGSAWLRPRGSKEKGKLLSIGEATDKAWFSAAGNRIVTLTRERLQCWDAKTGQRIGKPFHCERKAPTNRYVKFHPFNLDGSRLVTLDQPDGFSVWDVNSHQRILGPITVQAERKQIFGYEKDNLALSVVALDPTGNYVVLATESHGLLTIWDVKANRATFQERIFRGYLGDVRFSQDGKRVAFPCTDNRLRVLELPTGKPAGPEIVARGTRIDLSPEGQLALGLSSENDTIQIWDVAHGEMLHEISTGFSNQPSAIWFGPANRLVSASTYEGKACTWKIPENRLDPDNALLLAEIYSGQVLRDNRIHHLGMDRFQQDVVGDGKYRKAWLKFMSTAVPR